MEWMNGTHTARAGVQFLFHKPGNPVAQTNSREFAQISESAHGYCSPKHNYSPSQFFFFFLRRRKPQIIFVRGTAHCSWVRSQASPINRRRSLRQLDTCPLQSTISLSVRKRREKTRRHLAACCNLLEAASSERPKNVYKNLRGRRPTVERNRRLVKTIRGNKTQHLIINCSDLLKKTNHDARAWFVSLVLPKIRSLFGSFEAWSVGYYLHTSVTVNRQLGRIGD